MWRNTPAEQDRVDWDFDDDAYTCGNNISCQFDLEMIVGEVPRYYEYKSKSMNTDADSPIEINPKQFKAYLSKIDKMEELEYVFQIEKLYKNAGSTSSSELGIANRFKKMIQNDTNGFFEVVWNNQKLRENLFGVIQPQNLIIEKPIKQALFITWIATTNNSFYNFIKAR